MQRYQAAVDADAAAVVAGNLTAERHFLVDEKIGGSASVEVD